MNIYEKLQTCRVELQGMNLKKSGENKFAKYFYYELGDFLPHINKLFHANKMFSMVSFTNESASLTIFNIEKPDERIVFLSPMGSADLKGCHDIQNIGATETYQRRYLYMTALEMVECDALDATTGDKSTKSTKHNGEYDENVEITADDVPFNDKTAIIKSECEQCQATMTDAQKTLSKNKYAGKVLCSKCQKGVN